MIKKICEVLAVAGNVFGAFFVAILGKDPLFATIGYVFFIIGSCSAIYLLRHSNASKSLIYINWFFFVVNIAGIIIRIPEII
jgi:hypothetical protein